MSNFAMRKTRVPQCSFDIVFLIWGVLQNLICYIISITKYIIQNICG